MEIVEVLWIDSNHIHGWFNEEEKLDVLGCTSIGYLKEETEAKVVLVASTCENGGFAQATVIPKPCVISIKKLGKE